jgi:hypothetical protein
MGVLIQNAVRKKACSDPVEKISRCPSTAPLNWGIRDGKSANGIRFNLLQVRNKSRRQKAVNYRNRGNHVAPFTALK